MKTNIDYSIYKYTIISNKKRDGIILHNFVITIFENYIIMLIKLVY